MREISSCAGSLILPISVRGSWDEVWLVDLVVLYFVVCSAAGRYRDSHWTEVLRNGRSVRERRPLCRGTTQSGQEQRANKKGRTVEGLLVQDIPHSMVPMDAEPSTHSPCVSILLLRWFWPRSVRAHANTPSLFSPRLRVTYGVWSYHGSFKEFSSQLFAVRSS